MITWLIEFFLQFLSKNKKNSNINKTEKEQIPSSVTKEPTVKTDVEVKPEPVIETKEEVIFSSSLPEKELLVEKELEVENNIPELEAKTEPIIVETKPSIVIELKPYDLPNIIDTMKRLGYKVFENNAINYDLNIVGVRSKSNIANKFDDVMIVFWKYNGTWYEKRFDCTTDPGTKALKAGKNSKGTAILIPDQYRNVYKIDLHNGKYEALCQRLGQVRVWRDSNKDNILDYDRGVVDNGKGINIHRANPKTKSINVEDWSEGCQVIANPEDFDVLNKYSENTFMGLVRNAAKNFSNVFTYTLLTESQLEETISIKTFNLNKI